jgi:hypothetical protein
MKAKDWQVRREERCDAPMEYADVGLTGKFKLATIVAGLNAAIVLFAFRLKLGFPTVLGLLALAFLFYVALSLSIYVFHKPARWAFLGILDSLILAYVVHWIP